MLIKEIIQDGHSVRLEQHDGVRNTFYVVMYDERALMPITNLTLALEFFDRLTEEKFISN